MAKGDACIYDNRFGNALCISEVVKVDLNTKRNGTDVDVAGNPIMDTCITLHTGYNIIFSKECWDAIVNDINVLLEFEGEDEDD
jgi:hypothetical protein